MNRRDCLKAALAAALVGGSHGRVPAAAPKLSAAEDIEARVRAARPLLGGPIPADLPDRLGATHYDGQYSLTDEPYLLEGCRAVLRLDMHVVKLWFGPQLPGYGFHSEWNLPATARLTDVARHPYFVKAFDMPFSTFVLEIGAVAGKRALLDAANDYQADEAQFRELAEHLLATYSQRKVTFILQHWEGDWLLRGKARDVWLKSPPADAQARCDSFARWLAARQRGVAAARAANAASQCRVYHAAEVNRVWDATYGAYTVASHVLPQVAVDLVSWSSYDGMGSPVKTWQGIELIRHYARPSPVFGKPTVYIGEVGKPEHGESEEKIVTWWDQALGVFLAQQIPWILQWELYCNEPLDGRRDDGRPRPADQMRGFWLIRPDGSLSYAGKYLTMLLKHAGHRLPPALRQSRG